MYYATVIKAETETDCGKIMVVFRGEKATDPLYSDFLVTSACLWVKLRADNKSSNAET